MSPACANCYARESARFFGARLFGSAVRWGKGMPRFERLEAARKEAVKLDTLAMKKGVRFKVFCNSMSDWLDHEVPIEWLAFLLKTIDMTPYLDWQLLTKRPENWRSRMLDVVTSDVAPMASRWFVGLEAPSNVWVGTTVEDQVRAEERIPELLKIPAGVRYLSCEPLLGQVALGRWLTAEDCGIHWVIVGGESGKSVEKTRPMDPVWARSLRDQCEAAAAPFLFKQWGEWVVSPRPDLEGVKDSLQGKKLADGRLMLFAGKHLAGRELDGRTWDEFPVGQCPETPDKKTQDARHETESARRA